MTQMKKPSPWSVIVPVGIGTCLSLMGDAALYAVLPTNTTEAGVTIMGVGILLSANRFVRLVLNGPAGIAFDRWPRRGLFVGALFIGAISTAVYGFTQGFWPLFLGRILWGLAWAGIWVGGNTIILDISDDSTRGKWIGMYTISFFLGASSGALLGGLLTDWFSYHQAMRIAAGLTLVGAIIALIFLKETRDWKKDKSEFEKEVVQPSSTVLKNEGGLFTSAVALTSVNRLLLAGFFQATLGYFLLELFGDQVAFGGQIIGVATLTGFGLGFSTLISMVSAPIMGALSDRGGSRWKVAAGGLLPGTLGFGLMAVGLPLTTLIGIPLTAITGGSNQGISTAFIGDLGDRHRQSRRLGVLFTVGDLASAVGPPLAYALMPLIGIQGVYIIGLCMFISVFVLMVRQAVLHTRRSESIVKTREWDGD